MKTLVGRGPLSIVHEPKAHVPDLAGFEIAAHEAGWTATRRAGMIVESLSLDASISEPASEPTDAEAEVEWTVTVKCVPDRTWFGGPTAAGSTLVSGAVAFWVTYESRGWLPRKPSLHFSLATVLLVVTFGVMLAVLYGVVAFVSRRLVGRMEQRPSRAVLSRVDRLAAFAVGIPQLGLASRAPETSSP